MWLVATPPGGGYRVLTLQHQQARGPCRALLGRAKRRCPLGPGNLNVGVSSAHRTPGPSIFQRGMGSVKTLHAEEF